MKSLSEDIIGAVFNRYKLIYQLDIEQAKACIVYGDKNLDPLEYPQECSTDELRIIARKHNFEKISLENDSNSILICLLNETEGSNWENTGYSQLDHIAFVSKMSHDIRTPMNALLGYVILAGTKINQPEVLAGYLNKILVSGKRTIQIINDVMDLVRLTSKRVTVENKSHDMGSVVGEIKKTIEPQTDAKTQTFVVEADIKDSSVLCDVTRLNQILLNLLTNSIKYTQPNGEIVFKIFQKEDATPGKVKFEFIVQDNGYGMSEEFQEHMYEPFEREHNAAINAIEGTGLGLSIAKMTTELLGGTIEVSSTIGEGTMFTVTLEFDKGDISANNAIVGMTEYKGSSSNELRYATDSLMSGKVLEGKRILVAEDNEINQEIITEILQQLGAMVEMTSNGQEAYEAVKNSYYGQFDVILMDVQMPVMDGNDATRRIRELSDGKLAKIPIVGVSANAFTEDRQKASDVGMNGYISKPIDIAELLGTIQGLL